MNFPVHYVKVLVIYPGCILNLVRTISIFRHLSELSNLTTYFVGCGIDLVFCYDEEDSCDFDGGGIALANS